MGIALASASEPAQSLRLVIEASEASKMVEAVGIEPTSKGCDQ